MTVTSTAAVGVGAYAQASASTFTGGAFAAPATATDAETTFVAAAADDQASYVPPPGARLADTDDAIAFTSANGRVSVRLADGGGDGLKVTVSVDGEEVSSRHIKDDMSFTMDGTRVSVDVDEYETGSLSWLPGVGDSHYRADVTVTAVGNPADDGDDQVVADVDMDDDASSTTNDVMSDQQLTDLVYQLSGADVSGQAGTRLLDGDILPSEAQRDRQASSVFLGDSGVGFIELGPEVPGEGSAPAIELMLYERDPYGREANHRLSGLLPVNDDGTTATGSIAIRQENGADTTFSWRFAKGEDGWVLEGVDVKSVRTDSATGQATERSWTVTPSGNELQAMFSELGMTQADYVAFGNALTSYPGFERFSAVEG